MTRRAPPHGSPPVAIRRAAPGDLPLLIAVEAASFDDPWSPRLLEDELRTPGAFQLLALMTSAHPAPEGTAVGYAAFRLAVGEGELLRLAVLPEMRGQGLGRRLLARGLEILEAAGASLCHLEVRGDNHGAITLYESLGFHLQGERPAYYADGERALLYGKELPGPHSHPVTR